MRTNSTIPEIYKQFTDTFSPTDNARDVIRFAKRRLSVDLKYGDVKKYLNDKKKWDERICEPFDSDFGREWFVETVQHTSYYQKWLIESYFKQRHHTTSSLASLGIVLNARLLSNYYLSKYDHEEDDEHEHEHAHDSDENKLEFDSDDEEDMDTLRSRLPFVNESRLIHAFPEYSISSPITIDKVLVAGVSVDQFAQVMLDFGCESAQVTHCTQCDKQSVSEFRALCKRIFTKYNCDVNGVIICNFDPFSLETGIEGGRYGHLSPIAAYHETADRVLLLDTFVDETWVKLDALYHAMCATTTTTTPSQQQSEQTFGYVVATGIPVGLVDKRPAASSSSSEGAVLVSGKKTSQQEEKRRTRHRKHDSSLQFEFDVNMLAEAQAQNYQSQVVGKTRRGSRRLSKQLRLYIEFNSAEGQLLWRETQTSPYHQKYNVVQYFQTEDSNTNGLVSMAICFNAKAMAYNEEDKDDEEEEEEEDDMYDMWKLDEESVMDLYRSYFTENIDAMQKTFSNLTNLQLSCDGVPKLSHILASGMSLENAAQILQMFGCDSVQFMHAYEIDVNKFRDLIKRTLQTGSQNNDTAMFVNYDVFKLGTGVANGHIAAIAAYNEKNDVVLLMDVVWMVGMIWVPLSLLYEAMNTIDDAAQGKYRGCITVQGIPLFSFE